MFTTIHVTRLSMMKDTFVNFPNSICKWFIDRLKYTFKIHFNYLYVIFLKTYNVYCFLRRCQRIRI